jgi:hypothetical protein
MTVKILLATLFKYSSTLPVPTLAAKFSTVIGTVFFLLNMFIPFKILYSYSIHTIIHTTDTQHSYCFLLQLLLVDSVRVFETWV